jgi:hypothetical protein
MSERLRSSPDQTTPKPTETTNDAYVIAKGATVYFMGRSRLCWMSTGPVYCRRLTQGVESKVELLQSLTIYRDGVYRTLETGATIFVAVKTGLIKSKKDK